MTETFVKAYFEGLANSNQDIENTPEAPTFYRVRNRMNLDEFDDAVRNMSKRICLLLEFVSGQVGEDDTPRDGVKVGLHVLIKTDELFANQEAARQEAKAILFDIFSRMRYDLLEAAGRPDNTDGALKAAGIMFDSAGNYDDMEADQDWYGKSIYFSLKDNISLIYNPSKWLN